MDVHEILTALSDQTRLRVLALLAGNGELCVCELNEALDVSQPKISRHLAILKVHGLVKQRRNSQWVFYSLHPSNEKYIVNLLELLTNEMRSRDVSIKDKQRLDAMINRPDCERV